MQIEDELSETTEPRTRRSWLRRLAWLLVILALLVALRVYWNRSKMASKLQETLAELDRTDPGWRLEDIEAARAEVMEGENSARVVLAAAEKIPKPWPPHDFSDEEFRLLPPNERLSEEVFSRLAKRVSSAQMALDRADRLADMPRGRHHLHIERNPIATLLPHVDKCRQLLDLLVYESMQQSQKGDSMKALAMCRAALNVARSIGDEPIMISQLVRSSSVIRVCRTIERTLGQGEPPPEDMGEMQKLLEDEDDFPSLLIAMRGERALSHRLFGGIEVGDISLNGAADWNRIGWDMDWLKRKVNSLRRINVREDHALYLSFMTRRLKDAQRPMHEQATLEKQFEQERKALPKDTTLTELLLSGAGMGASFRIKHALIRCAIVALAAERFRHDKKAWPESSEKLCPQYLHSVPLDPFDGKPLRYRRLKDGVVIYAVGRDSVDNGGKINRQNPSASGGDIGFRLWDVPQRRQQPQPKLAGETKPQ